MTAQQIRQTFLDFFVARGHIHRPSSSLVPDNDPSVLLTTAGMQQFKPYFLGEKDPQQDFGARRTTTVQKSFRTSDIDEVGDVSHLTFFEMLGFFSFGDYWKQETIDMTWELLTKELKIQPDRIWGTFFGGDEEVPRDEEAEQAWRKYLPAERVVAGVRADNFWGPAGKTGVCGPAAEVYVRLTDHPSGSPSTSHDFIEIGTLVFMEYNKITQGSLKKLPQKNIDVGLGLERMAMVVNKQPHIFATDIYQPIMTAVARLPGFGDSQDNEVNARRTRIVADHLRAAVFLLADGVTFSNKDQGYILRRIVRRAADQFMATDFSFDQVIDTVVDHFSSAYPELRARAEDIKRQMNEELQQYRKILDLDVAAMVKKIRKGTGQADQENMTGPGHILLSPDEAFTLYATHGVSLDRLTRLGFGFERTAVEERIEKHQAASRAGAEKKFGGHGLTGGSVTLSDMTEAEKDKMTRLHTATHLLHAALRQILGPGVKQMGSDITPERLRFDFSFHRKLTDEEKLGVETLVNEKIRADLSVTKATMPYQEAINSGALAFFKEKYPATVSVYSISDFSKELCGGPHVEKTGHIGQFRLTAEQSVGSGVRRIKGEVLWI